MALYSITRAGVGRWSGRGGGVEGEMARKKGGEARNPAPPLTPTLRNALRAVAYIKGGP